MVHPEVAELDAKMARLARLDAAQWARMERALALRRLGLLLSLRAATIADG